MSNRIRQEIEIAAPVADVYAALTQAKEFSALSGGAPTEIDPRSGGAFSCFGGMIHGMSIELVKDARVVQAWRVKNWDPGVYSIAHFELASKGDGTKITFEHTGFPEGQGEHLGQGWHQNYWEPLKRHFA